MRETLLVQAEGFAALRRLWIVKSDTLDETAIAGTTRIGNHEIEERALFGTAARQTNHYHWNS